MTSPTSKGRCPTSLLRPKAPRDKADDGNANEIQLNPNHLVCLEAQEEWACWGFRQHPLKEGVERWLHALFHIFSLILKLILLFLMIY